MISNNFNLSQIHFAQLNHITVEQNFVEVTENTAMDSAEKRINELGYKQELR